MQNIYVYVHVYIFKLVEFLFLGEFPKVEIAGSYIIYHLKFLERNLHTVSIRFASV